MTSRARVFRLVAGSFGLFLLLALFFDLLLTVILWLPDDAVLSVIDDIEPIDLIHRIHEMTVSVMAWGLLIGVLVQLRHPERKVASMLMAVSVPVVIAVPQLLAGQFSIGDADNGPILIPAVVVALLHPKAREMLGVPHFDRPMLAVAAAASIPWLVFAVAQLRTQWDAAGADPHAQMGHYTYMMSLSILIVLWSVIGASSHGGWRVPAWVAGLASINFGLHSLAFSNLVSAAPAPWALAAIGWGVVFVVATERRARLASHTEPATAGVAA